MNEKDYVTKQYLDQRFTEFEERLDKKFEQKFEEKFEQKFEEKFEQKFEEKFEQKFEEKFEQKFEEKFEPIRYQVEKTAALLENLDHKVDVIIEILAPTVERVTVLESTVEKHDLVLRSQQTALEMLQKAN